MPAAGMREGSATKRAYDHAKQRILSGRWAGGDLVSEGEVAGALGISRTPVREAFLQLESEGLLRLYPKRGALVVPVSAQEVEAVLETRLMVERFALEKALRRGFDLVPEMERSLARQQQLAEAGRVARFAEADRQFHRAIVAAAGNPIALDLYDSLRDRQQRMLAVVATDQAEVQRILDEHRALTRAVAAGDTAAATSVLERHLELTRAALRGERAAG